jgi:small subunit ribosomal protein S6e
MAEIKINIGDSKTKKTYNKTITSEQLQSVHGKKIGDTISGDFIELPGYELQIKGGSDKTGTPMRKDVSGTAAKRILIVGGVGLRNTKRKGKKIRKRVAGNTVYEKTSQLNLAVVKWGKDPIEPLPEPEPAPEAQATESADEAKPAEE